MGSTATDAVLVRYQAEVEEKKLQMDGIVEGAQAEGRDVTEAELELYNRHKERLAFLEQQMTPLREGARIAIESSRKLAEYASLYERRGPGAPGPVEYKTAGAYVADMYLSGLGDGEARERLDLYQRAAAHQTTADNPGLLPEHIVQPIVNYVEVARALSAAIGVVDLGGGSWSVARVTQHTQVGKQAGEKQELPSRKMTVTKTPLGQDTFGGYVNVSKQDINRTSPAILDMVITDLAQQYAIETEDETGTVLTAAAVAGPTIPATPTGADIATAIWGAAGMAFAATKGQGRILVAVSPDMLGLIGPIFPPINPQNAFSSGFPNAANVQQGPVGSIAGLQVVMTAGLNPGTVLVLTTAAAACYEHVYGNLQVVEPSVWGVQVGYAGDFDCHVVEPTGIIKITQGV
jgi:hypothetical protein